MKESKPKKLEGGITLISLIATIIILVIVSAIAVKMVTGDNDLIGTTTDASENYKVTEYKEMISQTITAEIQKNMMQGEGTSLNDIATALEEKNDIKTANVYEDETIQNSDILVTTVEGYVIQVYYSDIYNVFYVEYLGKGNETDFPSVNVNYKKTNDKATISTNATVATGNIKQIEITKSGEVIARNNGETIQDTEITESGWYQIKTETTKGRLRYAWVRVTSINQEFETPIITVSEGERGSNDWYRQNLKIKITSTDEGASKINYMLNNVNKEAGTEEGTWQVAEGPEVEIPIETEGTAVNETTEAEEVELTEADIGRTVDYRPNANPDFASYTVSTGNSGTSSTQSFSIADQELDWIFWGQDHDFVYIISKQPTAKKLALKGNSGYNNGVTLLNQICSACWSDPDNYPEITCRSVALSDILMHLITPNEYVNFGKAWTPSGSVYVPINWKNYDSKSPTDLDHFEMSLPLTTVGNSSVQTAITGCTRYVSNIAAPSYYATPNAASRLEATLPDGANTEYWLATRQVGILSGADFGLQCVYRSRLDAMSCSSVSLKGASSAYERTLPVRPLIVVPKATYAFNEEQDGLILRRR